MREDKTLRYVLAMCCIDVVLVAGCASYGNEGRLDTKVDPTEAGSQSVELKNEDTGLPRLTEGCLIRSVLGETLETMHIINNIIIQTIIEDRGTFSLDAEEVEPYGCTNSMPSLLVEKGEPVYLPHRTFYFTYFDDAEDLLGPSPARAVLLTFTSEGEKLFLFMLRLRDFGPQTTPIVLAYDNDGGWIDPDAIHHQVRSHELISNYHFATAPSPDHNDIPIAAVYYESFLDADDRSLFPDG